MWNSIARFILRYRILLLVVIAIITCFMCFKARKVKIGFNFVQLLPASDSASVEYERFKTKFGIDGTVMLLGMQFDSLFSNVDEFNDWYDINYSIKNSAGIKDVLSVASLLNIVEDDKNNKFRVVPLLNHKPGNRAVLDSFKRAIFSLPFYEGLVLNKKTGSTLMAVTFKDSDVNSPSRIAIVDSLRMKADRFAEKYHFKMHYSGMPYIRTVIQRKLVKEIWLFLLLSILVESIILLLFFRSLYPVLFPLFIVIIGVIWSVACMAIFGYYITVLTGLIPAIIMVIGIPNSILLLNKYHTEYNKHGNRREALLTMVSKVGISTFLANVTTAIGFVVFCFTQNKMMFEFGLIASLNIMCIYVLTLILVPVIFSFLPAPHIKHTLHLNWRPIVGILNRVDNLVHHHRKAIYTITILLILLSLTGIVRLKAFGYVVDDLPQSEPICMDMKYFEQHFGGVLPLEIEINTHQKNGVFANDGSTIYKIERLERMLKSYGMFSHPVSLPEGVKFANQVYHDGKPKYYIMPSFSDLNTISNYVSFNSTDNLKLIRPFIDKDKQAASVNLYMADIGSYKMKEVLASLSPRADSIFNYSAADKRWLPPAQRDKITFTGSCLMFLKGNDFLVNNLIQSVFLAIVLIAFVFYLLFLSPKVAIIYMIPSLIPPIITLGIMGYFDIHLKPATILIFSIAIGISSDGTMYFLTKYRQDLKLKTLSISEVVSQVIRETGFSMIYTAIILSSGFFIFVFSGFGGTKALGILVSITLLMAYCSNLVLLPSFILSLEKNRSNGKL